MTERQGSEVIEILRSRLGMQYRASIDGGRREIARVLADELRIGSDEADTMVGRMLDAGTIRYVVGDERDPVVNDEGRVDTQGTNDMLGDGNPVTRHDPLLGAAVGQGGPSAAASGQMGGPVTPPGATIGAGGPVAAPYSGGTSPGAAAIAGGAQIDANTHGGYWDFAEAGKGVVPSTTRKGQVEPKGT